MTLACSVLPACGTGVTRPSTTPPTSVTTTAPPTPAAATTTSTTAQPTTTAAPSTTVPTTAPPPPYPVTQRSLAFVDPTRPTVSRGRTLAPDRPLTTLVWAPAGPGPWPLVIFAAGYAVGPQVVASLLGSWASRGYVVAAPEFPLEDPDVFGTADLDEGDLAQEPADVRFVLRALLGPSDPVRATIDGRGWAMAGHSDGAEVALSVATGGGLPAGTTLRAAIIMSGQTVGAPTTPDPPMLVTQGDADTINPPANGYAVYQQATPPKFLLTLLGGGHLPPLQAGSAWLPTIEAVTGNFLDAYLGGEAPAVARMEAAGNVPRLTTLQVTPGP
jgi:dienelactone hydrolase